jgi:hypothetical protein
MAGTYITPIAGAYSATWNAVDIGSTWAGYDHIEMFHDELIRSDPNGDAPVDGIQLGQEVEVVLTYIEYAKIIGALYAQMATPGTAQGTPGAPPAIPYAFKGNANVGVPLTFLGGPLVLTLLNTASLPNTKPLTRTYHNAIIRGSFNVALASRLRKGPIRFHCFPDATGSVYLDT